MDGFFSAGGSHTLERVVNEVTKQVEDPQTGVSAWERARARRAVAGDPSAQREGDLWIAPLGSGSDVPPTAKDEVPFFNFSMIQNAVGRLEDASDELDRTRAAGFVAL